MASYDIKDQETKTSHIDKIIKHLGLRQHFLEQEQAQGSLVMLPILHSDWKPCLSVNIIVFALELFLSDPP